ncbi:MAG TPA: hypothetical protein VG795_00720 [Acidimicrobiia bacterium]|nr:hypothetical protein [Acidimicrobiia bacterium]
MRRAAASILVTLGLIFAGVAWWAYAARYTVLDEARSERIADTLVTQPVIQDAVAEGLGNALQQALPPGTPISPDEISAIAHQALADPTAMAALKRTLLTSHQRLVGSYDGPVSLDVSSIAVAGRDALVAARPDLAEAMPEAPSLSVDLPTQHLPKLGWLPERTRELLGLALMLAITLLSLGVLCSSDRPKVLSRAGRWALRAGVFWAVFGWVLPYLMTKIDEPRLAALGAIGVATVDPMIAPAVLVISAGIAALLGGRAWRLALAALPPAPPSGGPAEPAPTLPVHPTAARPADPFRRPRQPVGTRVPTPGRPS